MAMERLALTVILGLATAGMARAEVPQTWEFRDGQWQQVESSDATTRPVVDSELDRIERMIRVGQNRSAFKSSVRWLKANKASPVRDRGLFLAGQALYGFGNRIKAFYYFDELMDTYPDSRYFYPALEKQYVIADAYLNGYKRRLWGMPILGSEDEAIEMLYRIQQRSPGSQLAEKALLRTADFYFATSEFDLSFDAYNAYVKAYPRSPVLQRVQLRQAFSSLAQFRGTRYDGTPLIDAKEQLSNLLVTAPELSASENVSTVIERIDDTFAKKVYQTADFYRRTHEPRAAVYTYRYLIQRYPNTPEAEKAKRWLDKMPQWALNEPAPNAPEALEALKATTQPAAPLK